VDENVDPAKLGGCARLSLTWGLGCPVGVGWVGLGLGIGPAGLLVCVLGKYLDPTGDMDRCGPQKPVYGVTKISGDRPRGLSAQGVTSDLRSSSRCVSARHLGQNIPLGVCGWELTSVVTCSVWTDDRIPARPS